MFNDTKSIYGESCIVLKRCSSDPQTEKSIANQTKTTEQAIKELGLRVIDVKLLEGVSGSIPGNRSDIAELIARKRNQNDFKVLVLQDTTRFTRSGQGHGQKLLYDLRSVGILVYFVAEDLLVNNEMAEMYASFLFAAARHTVKQSAYAATSGSANSFLSGKSPYSRRPPMGLDRLYTDPAGGSHIIRNLPDGTQQQIDPQSGAVTRTFARNQKKGVPNHYIKQKNERIRLITGDPRQVAIVYLIYHLHHVQGQSYHFIALHLNDSGILSAEGKDWHTKSVRDVLLRPIYVGEGIRGRTKAGIYYVEAEGRPTPSEVTIEDLANISTVRMMLRPREEWMERPQPHLTDFLPEEVRDLAKRKIHQHLESIADAKPKKPNRDSHRKSVYLLKGILRSKQGNNPMTGRVSGNGYRYYAVSRGTTAPKTNTVLRNRVPAQPLEDAVMLVLKEVLRSMPNLTEAIKNLILQNVRQHDADQENPERLEKDILRKQKQLLHLCEGIDLEEDDVLSGRITKIKSEIRELKRRCTERPQSKACTPIDAEAMAALLAQEMLDVSKVLEGDIPHVTRLLSLLIGKMEVDLVTKEVEIEFSLPSWVGKTLHDRGAMGLDELSACNQFIQAHTENREILDVLRCVTPAKPVCYECRRVKRAA